MQKYITKSLWRANGFTIRPHAIRKTIKQRIHLVRVEKWREVKREKGNKTDIQIEILRETYRYTCRDTQSVRYRGTEKKSLTD